MTTWWDGLTGIEQFFYCIAVPSTLILVIQFVLSFIGLDSDMDVDIDGDLDFDSDIDIDDGIDAASTDFRFISFRGIIAFLTIFSWTGILLVEKGNSMGLVIVLSTIAGLGAMLIVGYLFYVTSKLQSSGNIDYKNAIGKMAEVYIPIPPKGQGFGKVQVLIQERLVEAEAVTRTETNFKTGERVRVVGVIGRTTLVVAIEN